MVASVAASVVASVVGSVAASVAVSGCVARAVASVGGSVSVSADGSLESAGATVAASEVVVAISDAYAVGAIGHRDNTNASVSNAAAARLIVCILILLIYICFSWKGQLETAKEKHLTFGNENEVQNKSLGKRALTKGLRQLFC